MYSYSAQYVPYSVQKAVTLLSDTFLFIKLLSYPWIDLLQMMIMKFRAREQVAIPCTVIVTLSYN